MRRITLHTFRKVERAKETMIRASMPKTHENDPTPLVFTNRAVTATKTLTYRLEERWNLNG